MLFHSFIIALLGAPSSANSKQRYFIHKSVPEVPGIVDFVSELLKRSLSSTENGCYYYFRDDSKASRILEEIFTLIDIQVMVLDLKTNNSVYPACNGYILAVNNLEEYQQVFKQPNPKEYFFEPHKRVVLFSDRKHNIDISRHLLLHGIDLLAVEGFDMEGSNGNMNTSSLANITLKSYTQNKVLLTWPYGGEINIDSELLKPAQWPPDIDTVKDQKLKLKIASFHCPPFVLFNHKSQPFGGLEFKILTEIADKWPMEFIRVETSEDYIKSNNKWGSVLEMVADGTAHIGTCSQWSTVVLNYHLAMTYPHGAICGTFLVRRPDIKPDSCFLLDPYNTFGGLIILVLSFIISLLLYAVDRLDINRNQKFSTKLLRFENVFVPYFHVVRLFTIGSLPVYPANKQNAMRCLWLAWSLLCGILAVHYAASIESSMTVPLHLVPMNKLEDMIRHGIRWRESEPSLKEYFAHSGCSLLKKIATLYEEGDKRTAIKDNSAVVVKVLLHRYITDVDYLDEDSSAHSKLIAQCFGNFYSVFALSRRSPLKKLFSKKIMEFLEHGFIEFWFMETVRKYGQKSAYSFFLPYNETLSEEYINLGKMQGAFYLLLAGHLLGFIVFLFEFLKIRLRLTYWCLRRNYFEYTN